MERVCENCAGEDDDLELVRRGDGTTQPSGPIAAAPPRLQPELWCFSCRSQYPHELAEG